MTAPLILRSTMSTVSAPAIRLFRGSIDTPCNCCVRFVAVVTSGSRNTHYRAARYDLTRTGLSPAGPRQPPGAFRPAVSPLQSWLPVFRSYYTFRDALMIVRLPATAHEHSHAKAQGNETEKGAEATPAGHENGREGHSSYLGSAAFHHPAK
jgi:hypothetical protein